MKILSYSSDRLKYKNSIRMCILGLMLITVIPFMKSDVDKNVYADEAEQLRDDAKEDLKEIQEQMENLEEFREQIAADLEGAAEEMESLMAEQSMLNEEISLKQEEIDAANDELLKAMTAKSEAYEAMKLRIQYMYENGSEVNVQSIMTEADSIADMLSDVEYAKSIHEADKRLQEDYLKAIENVKILQASLDKDMEELLEMQEEFSLRQANLEVYMEGLGEDADSYAEQLAAAEEQAEKYEAIIKEQERIIAEKKAAEEAARREEEERKKQEAENNNNNNDNNSSKEPQFGSSGYLTDSSFDPAFKSEVTGEELVKYALQFVGNPYKWGGNSLTEGCDCSGFVKLIYEHFGFETPRYSQSFKTYGEPVAFENIKAGDIVVYPGHVAIYMGDGYIVEALNSKKGITCNRLVTCAKITAIRRVL